MNKKNVINGLTELKKYLPSTMWESISDAIALLKEQEAVKPVKQIEQTEWTVCGNCRNHIISKWMFCPYCGKPVLWEQERISVPEVEGDR